MLPAHGVTLENPRDIGNELVVDDADPVRDLSFVDGDEADATRVLPAEERDAGREGCFDDETEAVRVRADDGVEDLPGRRIVGPRAAGDLVRPILHDPRDDVADADLDGPRKERRTEELDDDLIPAGASRSREKQPHDHRRRHDPTRQRSRHGLQNLLPRRLDAGRTMNEGSARRRPKPAAIAAGSARRPF